MYQYIQVQTTESELNACNELLCKVFPKSEAYNDAYIGWEYLHNPEGEIVGFNAWKEKEIAAHYVAQPLLASINGGEYKGLLSLNTATHPDHQGKKLFINLAEKTYDLAASKDYKFVIGVANANSTHGFINKLGFQLVGPLEAKIGFGKIHYKDLHNGYSFERLWNKKSMNWRLANPNTSYEVIDQTVYAPSGKFGIKVIMGKFNEQLTGLSHDISTSISINPLKLFLGIDRNIDWKKSSYYNLPNRFRPSPLNLIFKDLSGKGLKLDISSLQFRAIDFDAY
jgi:hypothetical protein